MNNFDEILAYMDSEEGQRFAEEFFQKIERRDKIVKSQIERFLVLNY